MLEFAGGWNVAYGNFLTLGNVLVGTDDHEVSEETVLGICETRMIGARSDWPNTEAVVVCTQLRAWNVWICLGLILTGHETKTIVFEHGEDVENINNGQIVDDRHERDLLVSRVAVVAGPGAETEQAAGQRRVVEDFLHGGVPGLWVSTHQDVLGRRTDDEVLQLLRLEPGWIFGDKSLFAKYDVAASDVLSGEQAFATVFRLFDFGATDITGLLSSEILGGCDVLRHGQEVKVTILLFGNATDGVLELSQAVRIMRQQLQASIEHGFSRLIVCELVQGTTGTVQGLGIQLLGFVVGLVEKGSQSISFGRIVYAEEQFNTSFVPVQVALENVV